MANEVIQDQDVQLVVKQTPSLVEKVTSLQVTDERTSKLGNDVLVAIKKMLAKLEDRRKFLVKPIKDHAKAIEDDLKKYSNPLKEAYDIARQKVTQYVVEVDRKNRAEEAKKASLVSSFLDEKVVPIEPEKKPGVTSSLGKSFTKKIWKCTEVIDQSKVPEQYKEIAMPKVNAAIRSGVREIPGLKIEEVPELNVRT